MATNEVNTDELIEQLERSVEALSDDVERLRRRKVTGGGESTGGVITALDLSEWARGRFTATYGASGRTATFAVTHENGLPTQIVCPSAGTITIQW